MRIILATETVCRIETGMTVCLWSCSSYRDHSEAHDVNNVLLKESFFVHTALPVINLCQWNPSGNSSRLLLLHLLSKSLLETLVLFWTCSWDCLHIGHSEFNEFAFCGISTLVSIGVLVQIIDQSWLSISGTHPVFAFDSSRLTVNVSYPPYIWTGLVFEWGGKMVAFRFPCNGKLSVYCETSTHSCFCLDVSMWHYISDVCGQLKLTKCGGSWYKFLC